MNTAEIRMRDTQLTELKNSMDVILTGYEKSKRQKFDLDDLNSKLMEYQIALDSFKIEIKGLKSMIILGQSLDNRKIYNKKYKEHKAVFAELKNQIEWKKTQSVKTALLDGAQTNIQFDRANVDALMEYGLKIQDDSKNSLMRTSGVIDEAKAIGAETAANLQRQNEQIGLIYDDLQEIDTTLARSTRIIKRMVRKIATDKYLWIITFLVLAAIITIIVLKTTAKKNLTVNTPTITG
jgi:hypothetical protein